MEVKIVEEAGLVSALRGMKFSFQKECDISNIDYSFKDLNTYESYMNTSLKLCVKDQGHSKFLEQIQVWFICRAPLYWWKQFDTYRVGTSKLSKSTMHTLMKKPLVNEDFAGGLDGYDDGMLTVLEMYQKDKDFDSLNKILPQSFLQTRMVNTNYKVLRNIILQRRDHKLEDWELFIDELYKQLQTPDLLGINWIGDKE